MTTTSLQRQRRSWNWLAIAIILAGAAFRVGRWLHGRCLWLDEIYLATSLISRNCTELLTKPLLTWQVAPPLYLLLERLCVVCFGPGERSLRLISLLSGLASLPLAWNVLRRLLRPGAAVAALAIFAALEPLIYYSSEVKPYSCDVACSLAIMLSVLRLMENPSAARAWMAAIVGVLAVFLSLPAVFVLAGAVFLLPRTEGVAKSATMIAVAWGAAFVALYLFFLRPLTQGEAHPHLVQYWVARSGFMPISTWTPRWLVYKFWEIASDPGAMALAFPDVALVAWFVGATMLRSRRELFLLAGPLVFVLAASALRQYPFGDRLALFIVPQLIALAALGAAALWTSFPSRCAAAGMVGLMLVPAWSNALYSLAHPPGREETLPAYRWLAPQVRAGDVFYFTQFAEPSFRFYQSQVDWPPQLNKLVVERFQPPDVNAGEILNDAHSLAGQKRVWVILIHAEGGAFDVHNFTVAAFSSSGRLVEQHNEQGARILLYDCSEI